jgi:hypothetical protein
MYNTEKDSVCTAIKLQIVLRYESRGVFARAVWTVLLLCMM